MLSYSGNYFRKGFQEALAARVLNADPRSPLGAVLTKVAGLGSGLLDAVNTAANLKVLDDITNVDLKKDTLAPKKKKRDQEDRVTMRIDRNLLSRLTPEQRKQLYFVVKKMRV